MCVGPAVRVGVADCEDEGATEGDNVAEGGTGEAEGTARGRRLEGDGIATPGQEYPATIKPRVRKKLYRYRVRTAFGNNTGKFVSSRPQMRRDYAGSHVEGSPCPKVLILPFTLSRRIRHPDYRRSTFP